MKKIYSFFLACFTFALCGLPSESFAQFETTKGRIFWLGFMQNGAGVEYNRPVERVSVYISASRTTSGRVQIPRRGWTRDFTVNAGTTVEIVLPENQTVFAGSDLIRNNGVLVTAEDTVNVYALNYKVNSSDASIILPVNTLRSDYTLMTYNEGTGRENAAEL